MKKNMIALLLSIVMTVGSIGGTPVLAAETTAEEAVVVEEETVEEATESSEEADTAESVEEIEVEPEQDVTEEAEDGETTEETEAIEETKEESAEIADTSAEVAEVEEPAVDAEEVETEDEVKDAALVDAAEPVASGTCGESVEWVLDDEGTLIISGSGDMTNYDVASTADYKSYKGQIKNIVIQDGITSIGDYAFYAFTQVESVSIPDSVNHIGEYVLFNCKSLSEMTVPFIGSNINADKSIDAVFGYFFGQMSYGSEGSIAQRYRPGDATAYYCPPKLKKLTITKDTTIPYSAFSRFEQTSFPMEEITIPENSSLGDDSFNGCTYLIAVNGLDTVSSMGEYVFGSCPALKSICISKNMTSDLTGVFEGCINVETITVDSDNTRYDSRDNCNAIIETSSNTLVHGCNATVIPSSVSTIASYAFCGLKGMENINIPSSVGKLDDYAFYNCSSLSNIVFQGYVGYIGRAFYNCNNIKSVEFLIDAPAYISNNCFSSSVMATAYYYKEYTDSWTNDMLQNYGAEHITWVKKCGTHNWDAGTITTEATCTKEGIEEFKCLDCTEIKKEAINAKGHVWNIESTVDKAPTCIEEGSQSIHCSVCDAIDETTVRAIPKKEHAYGDWTVTKAATCTEVGSREKVCADCGDKVTEVIPSTGHVWNKEYTTDKEATCTGEGSESIHCTVCGEINESTVRSIPKADHAYGDWTVVKEATCTEAGSREKVCADCGDKITEEIPATGHIWNEEYTVDKEATYFEEGSESIHCSICDEIDESTVRSIPKKAPTADAGICGENAIWTLTGTDNDLTLTISGSGEIYSYYSIDVSDIPWASKRAKIKSVVIEDGITGIGDYSFYSFSRLTDVRLPDTITYIGSCAFNDCICLASITIPDGVTYIRYGTFKGCKRLGSAVIPNGLTEIEESAFEDCSNLENITIPESVTSIGSEAFKGCSSLTRVSIPDGITGIEGGVFEDCSNLTTITIPNSVTSIGGDAFRGCDNLKDINIPDGVTEIGLCAFQNCTSLTDIVIPDDVTVLSYGVFGGCTNLVSVVLPDNLVTIEKAAFDFCPNLKSLTIPADVLVIKEYAFGYGIYSLGDSNIAILFRGTKAQWDAAVGNNEVYYKSIVYNYFSVDADFKLSGTSFNYTGKPIKPAVTVTYNGQQLIEGTDYELVYKNNTNAGKASVDINGIGDYSGTATKTFTIKKAPNTITAKSFTRTYSTKAQTFELGVKIKNGTPTYTSNSKSVTVSKAGKVTVKAKFIGKATITITAPEKTNYSKQTKKITITVNPTKTALSSVTSPSAGKMTVKWKKNAVGSGYQIQYSTSSKFTSPKAVSVTKNTTLTKTIGGLAKGKKYYVRIRTYKTVGSTKFYSAWSAAKTVTIKK